MRTAGAAYGAGAAQRAGDYGNIYPAVGRKKLYHPSLPENQGHKIARASKAGAMLGYELDGDEQTLRVVSWAGCHCLRWRNH